MAPVPQVLLERKYCIARDSASTIHVHLLMCTTMCMQELMQDLQIRQALQAVAGVDHDNTTKLYIYKHICPKTRECNITAYAEGVSQAIWNQESYLEMLLQNTRL